MKASLKKALGAKQAQREKSRKKSFAEKLGVIERMRERSAVIDRARRWAASTKRGPRG